MSPLPRPRPRETASLFTKEENEGRICGEGIILPLPRPWPCPGRDDFVGDSSLEFSGSGFPMPSSVNWNLLEPPRPLPPPPLPADEVEKAEEMKEGVVVVAPTQPPITGNGNFPKLLLIFVF